MVPSMRTGILILHFRDSGAGAGDALPRRAAGVAAAGRPAGQLRRAVPGSVEIPQRRSCKERINEHQSHAWGKKRKENPHHPKKPGTPAGTTSAAQGSYRQPSRCRLPPAPPPEQGGGRRPMRQPAPPCLVPTLSLLIDPSPRQRSLLSSATCSSTRTRPWWPARGSPRARPMGSLLSPAPSLTKDDS
jgi:hypothetical protein